MRYAIYSILVVIIVCALYWIITITIATANMHTRLKAVESQMREIKELQNGGQTGIQP
jgi:hypothetical protein